MEHVSHSEKDANTQPQPQAVRGQRSQAEKEFTHGKLFNAVLEYSMVCRFVCVCVYVCI